MKEIVSAEDESSSSKHLEFGDDNKKDKPQLPLDTISSPPSQSFDYPQEMPCTHLKWFDKIIKDVKEDGKKKSSNKTSCRRK